MLSRKMGLTILTVPLLVSTLILCVSAESLLMGGHLDNKNIHSVSDDTSASSSSSSHLVLARTAEDSDLDLIAEESGSSVASTPYPDQEPRYKPYTFAFNGGKPFSLEKDPITGKIDFEKTPPLKALNLSETYADEEVQEDTTKLYPSGKIGYLDSKRVVSTNSKNERVGPNEINPYSPSFHDFLNLPVRYTSDKYDRENYPLISSSYANTKVQSGSNSYNINNHRPYHQETATKVSISTATRKVYYPKSTSTTTTTTTTTTMKPKTTTTTTTTTTTPKAVEKKTTTKQTKPPTTTTTTTTTMAPSTTTTTSTQPSVTQPKITTWKPSKSTNRYEEYEEVLPIEKLQGNKFVTPDPFANYPMMVEKEMNGHNNGPQSPTRPTTQSTYDYNDGYEDYESSPEDHSHSVSFHQHQQHHHHQQQQQPNRVEIVQSVELDPSTIPTTTSTTTTTITTSAPAFTTTTSSTSAPSVSTPMHQQQPLIHLTTSKSPMHQQQPPVTSMPLDSGSGHVNVPPVHENFVEGHRPVEFFNKNNNNHVVHSTIHFPGNNMMYNRPGSVINVLPESTSNVIVPHDQDTVSFVLGNRQNVEGSYYTHGTSMEEHTYVPNTNENNFRPIFSSPSNSQQSMIDQKVSVGLPSVAVVEPSSPSNYNPQKWYSPGPMAQVPVKTDSDSQHLKPQSSIIFPSATGNGNSQKDGPSKPEDGSVSSYVSFPDSVKDNKDPNTNPRPNIEEHIIVINQADGSIKEITPNGSNNFADNSVILNNVNNNGNSNVNVNNNNNPNLPQLSENLTPPAESRPSRPPALEISQRPPYYFHYQHGNGPNGGKPSEYPQRPQRIPSPPRQKPELPPVGFKRRPTAPLDAKLPNILPQFRPNAKVSHGHRGTDKIGTLPAPQSYLNRRPPSPAPQPPHVHPSRRPQPHPPISPPPSHLQRLSPPPPPPPGAQPPHHHLHHHQQQQQQQQQAPHQAALRKEEELKRYRPVRPQKLRMEDEVAGERFSAEPPQVPPRPIIFPKNRADSQMPKVATLQMIQQRGALDEEMIRSNLPPLFKINRVDEVNAEENKDENSTLSNETDRRKDGEESDGQGAAGPVYVVYPVNSAVNIGSQEDLVERDETVVIGTRGPHRPLPPDTLPQDEEDNKPDEDKLSGYYYGKRPQHHNTVNTDFGGQGYPIDRHDSLLVQETPLLVPSDDLEDEDSKKPDESSSSDSSFNVISYLQDFLPFSTKKQQQSTDTISATLPRLPLIKASSSPIAYVYTPTTPSALHRHNLDAVDDDEDDQLDYLRQDHRDEQPVLLPSRQPSSSSSSAPSPQNFMAPFVASVSAEMPAKNGWSVVASPTTQVNGTERTKDEKKDLDKYESVSQENDAQTEKADGAESFDPESFKPQLFGGFKPIYEFPIDEEDHTPMVGRGVLAKSDVQAVNVNADAGRKLEK